ncbi:hypothetical protein N5D61_02940 [Pseudomonas sp. GD03842]|uniref:hypothetical protein n=1 Tax=Pseudomonas sp. GD03842 TaxID=2975385 RepID=UPI0024468866|nr:hypothetical protein [Pseudomonas sp. GD03842]MDH0745300.1 hypothetical protein [Pseudomonas sp. GD03842]
MRILVGALAVALLAGCSSNPISLRDAKQAPADKVFAFQSAPVGAAGKITVLRDGGVNGSACDFVVYVDGKKSAELGSGEKASFLVSAGTHNVGAGVSGVGLCSGQAIRTFAVNVTSSNDSTVRLSSDMTGITIGPYVEYQ